MCVRFVRIALMLSVVGIPTLAVADEVAEFRDGRYLKIRSHEVLKDAVRLDVTADSFLIVPLSGLDRIERRGQEVYRRPDSVAGLAQRVNQHARRVADTGDGSRLRARARPTRSDPAARD